MQCFVISSNLFQSVAVVSTMNQLLNDDLFALYEESNNSLGEMLLKSSEGYVNYLASAMNDSGTAMKAINMTNISKLIAAGQLQYLSALLQL